MIKALLIYLETGKAFELPQEELEPATQGLDKVESKAATTYKGEEYMVVVLK